MTAREGLYGSSAGRKLLPAFIVEAIGTGILVLVGCAVAIGVSLNPSLNGNFLGWLLVAAAFGLPLIALIGCFGHVSGGNFNPLVTLALALTGRLNPLIAVIYGIAQALGGWGAAMLLKHGPVNFITDAHLGAPQLVPGMEHRWLLAAEAIATAVFIVLILQATDRRTSSATASLHGGLSLLTAVFIGLFISGGVAGSVNWARAFGPLSAIHTDVNGWRTYLYVFGLGSLLGAIGGVIVHVLVNSDQYTRRVTRPQPRPVRAPAQVVRHEPRTEEVPVGAAAAPSGAADPHRIPAWSERFDDEGNLRPGAPTIQQRQVVDIGN